MAKKIFYDDDARERVLGGAKALYDAVKVTYGPKGRNVVIGKGYGGPTVTHDGVTKTPNFKKESSEYNDAMRDAIRANPEMSEISLDAILEAGISWANAPEPYHHDSKIILNKVKKGVVAEIVAEQLLEHTGLTFERASVRADLKGVDFIVDHPDARDPLLIDIKSGPEQVVNTGMINSSKPLYRIARDNRVVLHTGVGDELQKGQLRLGEEHIEPKGIALLETLEEISGAIRTKDDEEIPALLAQLAVRFNGPLGG